MSVVGTAAVRRPDHHASTTVHQQWHREDGKAVAQQRYGLAAEEDPRSQH